MSPQILSDEDLANRLRQLSRELFNPANKYSEAEWCKRLIKVLETVDEKEWALLRKSLLRG